jgi:type II secretory pathway pseudopilin PulG
MTVTYQRGFSLTGVLVAVAIAGVVAATVAQIFSTMLQTQNTIRMKGEMETFNDELRARLANRAACVATFQAAVLTNGTATPIPTIKDAAGTDQVLLNTPYGGASFEIQGMNFVYADEGTPGNGTGILSVSYRSRLSMVGGELRPREIRIKTTKNTTTNALVDCVAMSKMTDGIWQRVMPPPPPAAQVFNDIFFTGGNVGIGVPAPQANLDVAGAIKSDAGANAGRTIDFSSGNMQYTSASCGAFILHDMKSGGSYSLAVQGDPGASAVACSFTAYSDEGTTLLTLRTGGVGLSQSPNRHILFSFMVMGNVAYVASINGY